MKKTALIVCIGNDLVGDDGVGHAIYHDLKGRNLAATVRLKLLGLGGMAMLGEFEGEDLLVVVDAVQFGASPGSIHVLSWEDLPQSESHVSCHGIGVREAIEVSTRLYPETTPKEVYLVGVEGICFNQLGAGLSREVAESVGRAADEILQLVAGASISYS